MRAKVHCIGAKTLLAALHPTSVTSLTVTASSDLVRDFIALCRNRGLREGDVMRRAMQLHVDRWKK